MRTVHIDGYIIICLYTFVNISKWKYRRTRLYVKILSMCRLWTSKHWVASRSVSCNIKFSTNEAMWHDTIFYRYSFNITKDFHPSNNQCNPSIKLIVASPYMLTLGSYCTVGLNLGRVGLVLKPTLIRVLVRPRSYLKPTVACMPFPFVLLKYGSRQLTYCFRYTQASRLFNYMFFFGISQVTVIWKNQWITLLTWRYFSLNNSRPCLTYYLSFFLNFG